MITTYKTQPGNASPINARKASVALALMYALLAGLWILISDELTVGFFSDPQDLHAANTLKGGLFVGVTAMLLFGLVHRLLSQTQMAVEGERAAYAEQARATQLLDALVNSSSDAIFAKDLSGKYLLVNRETLRLIGKAVGNVIGETDETLFPPPQAKAIRANDLRVMEEHQIITYEESVLTADGLRIYLATKGPLRDAGGTVIGMFGISRDITARVESVQVLQKQAEALQQRNEELDRFNRAAVGRELAQVALKRQINELSQELGRPPPYRLADAVAVESANDRADQ